MTAAVRHGCVRRAKWLHKRGYVRSDEDCVLAAAETGNVAMMRWLQTPRLIMTGRAVEAMAVRGDIAMLKAFMPLAMMSVAAIAAAMAGHISILEWAYGYDVVARMKIPPEAYTAAAKKGRKDVLSWLLEHKVPAPENIDMAVSHVEPSTLSWLLDHGFKFTPAAYRWAVNDRSLTALAWLHENGVPITECEAAVWAAEYGYFDALRWLREHGAPWSADVCTKAWNAGFTREQLAWIRKNACVCGGRNHFENRMLYGQDEDDG
ncbi:MAG: hypothetical protein KGL39_01160 [Patescibacteria group bacterium]|nr:hypothetical protein [Patescibacteria group bacterium]